MGNANGFKTVNYIREKQLHKPIAQSLNTLKNNNELVFLKKIVVVDKTLKRHRIGISNEN